MIFKIMKKKKTPAKINTRQLKYLEQSLLDGIVVKKIKMYGHVHRMPEDRLLEQDMT